jgi:hypothetical protein
LTVPIFNKPGFKALFIKLIDELNPGNIPNSRDHLVCSFKWAGCKYYIKYYCINKPKGRLQSLLHCSKPHKAWGFNDFLSTRGIATPELMAHLQKGALLGKREHLIITKGIRGHSLREAIDFDLPLKQRKDLLRAVAHVLAKLHDVGVYHGDFSAFNIMVEEAPQMLFGWRVYIIDLEAIRSLHYISLRRQIKNLEELGRNFTNLADVSTRDRLRFLKYYIEGREKRLPSARKFRTKICKRTYKRMRYFGKEFHDIPKNVLSAK